MRRWPWMKNTRRDSHKQVQTQQTPMGFFDRMHHEHTPVYSPKDDPHQERPGAQASAAEIPAGAQANWDLTERVMYPRSMTCLPIENVQVREIQIEQNPGFLADFFYFAPPNAPQSPVDYKAPVYPLEGVHYRNAQISTDDYFALAVARVQAMLSK